MDSIELTKSQKHYRENWAQRQIATKRWAARKSGTPFNIETEDIIVPAFCPVLGLKLEIGLAKGAKDNSPSIDKIDPKLGYVKGNIQVISLKANRIKNDATFEEFEKVYLWLKENQKEKP
jgi:hypothetical protein